MKILTKKMMMTTMMIGWMIESKQVSGYIGAFQNPQGKQRGDHAQEYVCI